MIFPPQVGYVIVPRDELKLLSMHLNIAWLDVSWSCKMTPLNPPCGHWHVLRSQEGAEAAAQEIFGWICWFCSLKAIDQPICSFRVAMSSDEDHSEQWPIRISWNVIRAFWTLLPFFVSCIFPVFFSTFSNLDDPLSSWFSRNCPP